MGVGFGEVGEQPPTVVNTACAQGLYIMGDVGECVGADIGNQTEQYNAQDLSRGAGAPPIKTLDKINSYL